MDWPYVAVLPTIAVLLVLIGLCGSARAGGVPLVDGLRFGVHGPRTRIVIDSTGRYEFKARLLSSPPRLVVDMPEVLFRIRPDPLGRPRGLVTGHRYGRLMPGRSRVVVDLARPARVVQEMWLTPSGESPRWRWVIDLEPLPGPPRPRLRREVAEGAGAEDMAPPVAAGWRDAARAEEGTSARGEGAVRPSVATVAPSAAPSHRAEADGGPESGRGAIMQAPSDTGSTASGFAPAPPAPRRFVVVIDPGHGGLDPGTIGVGGVQEKDVTLAVARAVRAELARSGRYVVHLTRDDDRFLPLRERVAFARRHGADLFISIHADSSHDPQLRGASVYTLSEKASDAEAERLARKENVVDVLAGVEVAVEDPVVASILVDLVQRDTLNRSVVFADALSREISQVQQLLRRHRRFAGFAVLKAPDVPSVLLEVGYLSNSEDAARLGDPAFQQKLAAAIRRAVDRWFDGQQTPF